MFRSFCFDPHESFFAANQVNATRCSYNALANIYVKVSSIGTCHPARDPDALSRAGGPRRRQLDGVFVRFSKSYSNVTARTEHAPAGVTTQCLKYFKAST